MMFSGYAQTGLLSSDQVLITEEGLRYFYLNQGGSHSDNKEYREYLKVIEGAEGVYTRFFIPSEGVRRRPESARPVHIITPAHKMGKMISDAYRRGGIMPPNIVISSIPLMFSSPDFDPTSLMPMVFRDKLGKWRRYDRSRIDTWPQEIIEINEGHKENKIIFTIGNHVMRFRLYLGDFEDRECYLVVVKVPTEMAQRDCVYRVINLVGKDEVMELICSDGQTEITIPINYQKYIQNARLSTIIPGFKEKYDDYSTIMGRFRMSISGIFVIELRESPENEASLVRNIYSELYSKDFINIMPIGIDANYRNTIGYIDKQYYLYAW